MTIRPPLRALTRSRLRRQAVFLAAIASLSACDLLSPRDGTSYRGVLYGPTPFPVSVNAQSSEPVTLESAGLCLRSGGTFREVERRRLTFGPSMTDTIGGTATIVAGGASTFAGTVSASTSANLDTIWLTVKSGEPAFTFVRSPEYYDEACR